MEESQKKVEATCSHTDIITYPLDVACPENVTAVFDAVKKELGAIDVCVYGAGRLSDPGKLHETSLSNFWDSFEVNVKGLFFINQAFPKQNAPEERGRRLIAMSSAVCLFDGEYLTTTPPASYALSKLGEAKLIECSTEETKGRKGFRAYLCHHGIVFTNMLEKSLAMAPLSTGEALTGIVLNFRPDSSSGFFKGCMHAVRSVLLGQLAWGRVCI